jgi:hypothetical protein
MPYSSPLSSLTLLFISLSFFGCKSEENSLLAIDCKSTSECAKGWLCGAKKKCTKDKRTPQEVEAARKAEIAQIKAKKEQQRQAELKTKAEKGNLVVKICPFYKRTPDSAGSILAVHQKTGERHYWSLQMEVPPDSTQATFTFPLPLGKYDVTAKYGIQVNGTFDTHKLSCDPKSTTRPCKEKKVREVEVVLAKDATKTNIGCDWIAE